MEDYGDPTLDETEASMVTWIWTEIMSSYLNICLTLAILYLVYKILFQKDEELVINVEPPKPPMKKQVNQNNMAAYFVGRYKKKNCWEGIKKEYWKI